MGAKPLIITRRGLRRTDAALYVGLGIAQEGQHRAGPFLLRCTHRWVRGGEAMKRSIKSLLATLVLSLSLAAPVLAGPYEDGLAASKRGDYATALRLWLPLAEQGDAYAQFNLGYMYAKGEGVPQDYAEAVKWYRKAAGQGDADAQFNLGIIYDQGKGVPQDYAKAVRWYRKAADQEDATAQNSLGMMYDEGQGVPQNYLLAHMWFNLASARGDKQGENNREIVAKKMTADQIAEAQRLAREWKVKK